MRRRRRERRDLIGIIEERRTVFVVSVGDASELERVVRQVRRATELTHIVVCCDDLSAFEVAFEAGVDAWVSTRADQRTIRSALGLPS